jgi:hypothetical protein
MHKGGCGAQLAVRGRMRPVWFTPRSSVSAKRAHGSQPGTAEAEKSAAPVPRNGVPNVELRSSGEPESGLEKQSVLPRLGVLASERGTGELGTVTCNGCDLGVASSLRVRQELTFDESARATAFVKHFWTVSAATVERSPRVLASSATTADASNGMR